MKEGLTEKALSQIFRDTMKNGAWASHYPPFSRVLSEVDCQQGRPDFVASPKPVDVISSTWRHRLVEGLAAPRSAKIISLLKYAAPRTESYLVETSGLTRQVVRKTLYELEGLKLVRAVGHGSFTLSSSLPGIDWELWAFEIKLNHWKRALYQALQYKAFAHRVAVVMPECWVHLLEKREDRFRVFGVGIIAINEDSGQIRFIQRPKKSPPASKAHYLYTIGKFLKG
ncbi:MAG: hypothetical protein ACYC9Q_08155 [Bacillota bacterium]